jgi:prepilin-type N-terminal cleavage/methylation domain-containing protein
MFFKLSRTVVPKVHKESQQGFTLVEALTALILLSIFSLSGIAIYANSNEIQTMAMHKKIATEMASSKIEEYRKYGYSSLPTSGTPVVQNINVGGLSAIMTTNVADVDDPVGGAQAVDYKQVQVNITWTETGKSTAKDVELTTYIVP